VNKQQMLTDRKVQDVITRIYERESKIKTKLSNLRKAKTQEEDQTIQSKPQISKKSQAIIDKKKKGWIPIYEPERIQQIQNSHQRTIRGIAEKMYHEKLAKVQEEEEIMQKYHKSRKMPIEHFDNKYEQYMDDYQKQVKFREEVRNKRELQECTFLPTTNHNSKKIIKQKMTGKGTESKKYLHSHKNSRAGESEGNKKTANKSIDVVKRMEKFQIFKNVKNEQRKRDLTPKFKPKVLESYNSRRSNKKRDRSEFKRGKGDSVNKENTSSKKFDS
jgi:hypothetical protein